MAPRPSSSLYPLLAPLLLELGGPAPSPPLPSPPSPPTPPRPPRGIPAAPLSAPPQASPRLHPPFPAPPAAYPAPLLSSPRPTGGSRRRRRHAGAPGACVAAGPAALRRGAAGTGTLRGGGEGSEGPRPRPPSPPRGERGAERTLGPRLRLGPAGRPGGGGGGAAAGAGCGVGGGAARGKDHLPRAGAAAGLPGVGPAAAAAAAAGLRGGAGGVGAGALPPPGPGRRPRPPAAFHRRLDGRQQDLRHRGTLWEPHHLPRAGAELLHRPHLVRPHRPLRPGGKRCHLAEPRAGATRHRRPRPRTFPRLLPGGVRLHFGLFGRPRGLGEQGDLGWVFQQTLGS